MKRGTLSEDKVMRSLTTRSKSSQLLPSSSSNLARPSMNSRRLFFAQEFGHHLHVFFFQALVLHLKAIERFG